MRAESAARLRACTAPGTATSPAPPVRTTSAVFTSLAGPAAGLGRLRRLVAAAGGEAEAQDGQDRPGTNRSHRQISPAARFSAASAMATSAAAPISWSAAPSAAVSVSSSSVSVASPALRRSWTTRKASRPSSDPPAAAAWRSRADTARR